MPCRPSEAQHTTTDAAPCPLVVGGSSNGKQRVNEQPNEPSQAWEAICIRRDAGALHFEVHGGALRKRSAPTWIDIFTTTSSLRGCKPWKRLPAWEVCRSDGPSLPTSNSHARAGTPVRG